MLEYVTATGEGARHELSTLNFVALKTLSLAPYNIISGLRGSVHMTCSPHSDARMHHAGHAMVLSILGSDRSLAQLIKLGARMKEARFLTSFGCM